MKAIKEKNQCMIIAGRRSGTIATITQVLENGFVMITYKDGKKDKERKMNMNHIEPIST